MGFDAIGGENGVELSWMLSDPGDVSRAIVEQGPTGAAPWQALDASIESEGASMRVIDATIAPGETRFYRLSIVDRAGATHVLGQVSATRPAAATAVLALSAGPNPARDPTAVTFDVPGEQDVRLSVFDIRGRLVKTLFAGRVMTGAHSATWDGRSNDDAPVSSGVYFVRLVAEVGARTERVMFVR